MKRNIILIIFVSSLVIFSGCGKDKVDYVTESEVSSSSDANGQHLKDKLSVEESWVEAFDGNSYINVDTAINFPDIYGVNVYEAEPWSLSPDERKIFMDNFFDEIYYYGDEYFTKDELKLIIEDQQKYVAELEAAGYQGEQIEESINYANDYIEKLNAQLENAPDTHVPADTFDKGIYLAKYNDMDFMVNFSGNYTDEYKKIDFSSVGIGLYDSFDMFEDPDSMREKYVDVGMWERVIETEAVENLCKISVDEARMHAVDFVEQMDVGNMQIVKEYPLKCYGTNEEHFTEEWYDGYAYVFHREIDELPVDGAMVYDYCGDMLIEEVLGEAYNGYSMGYEMNYGLEEILVCVNSKGVISMDYVCPIKIKNTVAKDVNLLSYDKIKTIFSDKLMTLKVDDAYLKFTNLDFVYFPLLQEKDDVSSISLIPAWRLTDMDGNDDKNPRHYLVINAMDGSVINVGSRIYKKIEIID